MIVQNLDTNNKIWQPYSGEPIPISLHVFWMICEDIAFNHDKIQFTMNGAQIVLHL